MPEGMGQLRLQCPELSPGLSPGILRKMEGTMWDRIEMGANYHPVQDGSKGKAYRKEKGSLAVRLVTQNECRREYGDMTYWNLKYVSLLLCRIQDATGEVRLEPVPRYDLLNWGISAENAIRAALENMEKKIPPRLLNTENLSYINLEERGIFQGDYLGEELGECAEVAEADPAEVERHGYLLTNTLWRGGAVAAFYPGVPGQLANVFHGGYYLVMVGRHDMRVHPKEKVNPKQLWKAAQRKFTSLEEGKRLPCKIFVYDGRCKRLKEVQGPF